MVQNPVQPVAQNTSPSYHSFVTSNPANQDLQQISINISQVLLHK